MTKTDILQLIVIDTEKKDTVKKDIDHIEGNLSIKDSTKNIAFSGNLTVGDSSIHLISDSFSIDRTKWGVIYKSTSFFSELGEKFIDDKVGLKIELKAKK
jgi:polyisoprenoid-binding protein YceI